MSDNPRRRPILTPEGEAFVRATYERTGPRKYPERFRGERQGRAKLTEANVRDILRRLADGTASPKALAAEYGVSQPTITQIARGDRWRHVERPPGLRIGRDA